MSEIDRRALITMAGVAGAGMLLSGCEDKPELLQNKTGAGGGTLAGGCELWGDSVNQPPPAYPPPQDTNARFNPSHICAAYIKFTATGLIVRHGYVVQTTPSQERGRIISLLQCLKDPTLPNPPIQVLERRDNFQLFSMRSHQIVVIFIDNPIGVARFLNVDDVRSDPNAPTDATEIQKTIVQEHIVRFSKYSGKDRRELEENRAFYDLQPVDVGGQGFDATVAYRINYYNMDKYRNGWGTVSETQPHTHRRYSMNIHLLFAAGGGPMIPIIIDPDTGNMGAQP